MSVGGTVYQLVLVVEDIAFDLKLTLVHLADLLFRMVALMLCGVGLHDWYWEGSWWDYHYGRDDRIPTKRCSRCSRRKYYG